MKNERKFSFRWLKKAPQPDGRANINLDDTQEFDPQSLTAVLEEETRAAVFFTEDVLFMSTSASIIITDHDLEETQEMKAISNEVLEEVEEEELDQLATQLEREDLQVFIAMRYSSPAKAKLFAILKRQKTEVFFSIPTGRGVVEVTGDEVCDELITEWALFEFDPFDIQPISLDEWMRRIILKGIAEKAFHFDAEQKRKVDEAVLLAVEAFKTHPHFQLRHHLLRVTTDVTLIPDVLPCQNLDDFLCSLREVLRAKTELEIQSSRFDELLYVDLKEYVSSHRAQLKLYKVVQAAVECLQNGGLVIFPTETTYGAGVTATDPQAVQKLLAYKARREGKPLSIAVTSMAMAEMYVELNDSARRLYQRFLPGPVTVVSKGKGRVAPGVESEFGTLGVRIPNYDLVLQLVAALNQPITATSANGSGEKRPYSISDIFDGLSDKQKALIDLVIDAGTLPSNPPSTVIDTTLSTPVTLRSGDISLASSNSAGVTTLDSRSEQETRDIAKRLLLKHWDEIKKSGLVIGLDGPLGAGKTIFTKGAAEFLAIPDTITSPTYTYLEEYNYQRHGVTGKLYHLDLWKVASQLEFERLEVGSLIAPCQVVIIEWFSQVEPWMVELLTAHSTPLIRVIFDEKDTVRQLQIRETTS